MDHSPSSGRDELRIDYLTYGSPSRAIVTAIAALENRDVMERSPLYETVDPEALDQLLQHAMERDRPTVVELPVDNYTVRAHSDGTLEVTDIPPELGSS
ncbi:hypothetical protein OB955_16150 [Halobacteria archaeon AArc-m2/3/4]|uniref:Halobacterial output domain-containing protein n=1 Tax=Natronoglomus mannanivorans TaxID=2979990 RepID=A0AAP2Z205_9EURY|nr:hypothetical protein [Halobacteria archaeon AArc-xg1-1]MCU4974258.1 hypothetical protein [Halobacteria archaeon AArc-m2/3/4]